VRVGGTAQVTSFVILWSRIRYDLEADGTPRRDTMTPQVRGVWRCPYQKFIARDSTTVPAPTAREMNISEIPKTFDLRPRILTAFWT
jgi:hypothetical protein